MKVKIFDGKLYASGSLIALAREYLEWMRVKNFAPSTRKGRRLYLEAFLSWCEERTLERPADATREVIEAYRRHLCNHAGYKGRSLSSGGRLLHLKAVLAYFHWLVKRGFTLYNPVEALSLPAYAKKKLPHNVLNTSEVEQILSIPDITTDLGIRNRTILEVFYSTGIRRCELVLLNQGDIDFKRGTLVVLGKGSKDRVVPIGNRALAWLEKYLGDVRPFFRCVADSDRLFLGRRGPLSIDAISYIASRYVNGAGIGKSGSCHIFRHTMATAMLDNGADIRYVQEILGHSDLNTTEIYTRVSIEKLKAVHCLTHPGAEPVCENTPDLKPAGKTYPAALIQQVKTKESTIFWQQCQHLFIALGNRYFDWMQMQNYSSCSIYERRKHLKLFIQWCFAREITQLSQLRRQLIEQYQSHLSRPLEQKILSLGRQRNLIIAVAGFCKWLAAERHMLYSPAAEIELPKMPKRLPRQILNHDEVERVMLTADLSTMHGLRDRAILETFYSTGIRREELLRVAVSDIDFERCSLYVHGKGGRDRIVPIGKRSLYWLEKYLSTARPLFCPEPDESSLFINRHAKAFSIGGLSDIVTKCIATADLGKSGSCHMLRHSMATAMLENGADIRHIQEILGHRKLSSTEIYTKVSIGKLKEIHTRTHPATDRPSHTAQLLNDISTP